MGALQIGTAVLASISFALLLAALASDYWVIGPDRNGLWEFCRGFLCQAYGMSVLGKHFPVLEHGACGRTMAPTNIFLVTHQVFLESGWQHASPVTCCIAYPLIHTITFLFLSLFLFPVGYIHATRFFLMMGAFAGAVSFFSLWTSLCRFYAGSFSTAKTAGIASLAAAPPLDAICECTSKRIMLEYHAVVYFGLCALIAMSIFTGVFNSSYRNLGRYGWSLAVGWASGPLFLLTGGLAFQIHAGRDM
uniref:uncharacterized protein LOC130474677 n=1 Tax=Euleptes europaea TaxID=460621 RepID=UPI0025402D5C|nr:uncharacterized protein LOC130474677 [Euleptes europaea]